MLLQSFVSEQQEIPSRIEELRDVKFPACKWKGERMEYALVFDQKGARVIPCQKDGKIANLECMARICPLLADTRDVNENLELVSYELIESWERMKEAIRAYQEVLGDFVEDEKLSDREVTRLYYRMLRQYREADGNVRILEEFLEGLKKQ